MATYLFDVVRDLFPSGLLLETVMTLPTWVYAHGQCVIKPFHVEEYDSRYPFVGAGHRRYFQCVPNVTHTWEELLTPWPWYVSLAIRPHDGTAKLGQPSLERRLGPILGSVVNRSFLVVYADAEGALALQVPEHKEEEIVQGFKALAAMELEVGVPNFYEPVWNVPEVLNRILYDLEPEELVTTRCEL